MDFKYIFYFLILFFAFTLNGFTQNYVIKSFTIEDGLPQTQVDDICQDSFGYLWVATRGGGLAKFDGKNFLTYKTNHGLPSNLIYKILWSSDQKLWIGTVEGLSVFDGKIFKNIYLNDKEERKQIISLAEDHLGNIWTATLEGGVFKIAGDSITYFGAKGGFTDKVMRKIVFNPLDKKVWFLTVEGELFYNNKNEFHAFAPPELKEMPRILTIYQEGNLTWYGTKDGLYRTEKAGTNLEKIPGIKEAILEIHKDASGNVWLGTNTGIVKMWGENIDILDQAEGIAPVPVNRIFEDKEGVIWFSGDNLHSSSTMKFKKLDISDGLPQANVMSLNFDHKEDLWIGMSGGISKFFRKNNENRLVNYDFNESVICGIFDEFGNPWFGTTTGIFKYENGELYNPFLNIKNSPAFFESVYKDKGGNIWWGGINYILRYKNGHFKSYQVPGPPNSLIVRSFGQLRSGQILIGTSTGLFQLSNEAVEKIDHAELASQNIMNILEDAQGMVWMGLYGDGLLRWDPEKNVVKTYKEEDGLTSNLIYCMIFDDLGRLWLGSERGIDLVKFDKDYNINAVKNLGKPEGFLGIETNHNAITKDSKGNIWIGTVKGVYTFNPLEIKINKIPPKLSLTGIKLYHVEPDWAQYSGKISNWNVTPDFIKLPYDKNHLTFAFQGISFQNPRKVQYSYMLQNFDKNWSPATDLKEAVYANIPPGNYTFLVKAKNEDGIWNATPVRFSFTVMSPLWMRWWFQISVLFIFLILGKIIYNYLVRQKLYRLLAIEKIKSEEAEKIRKIVAKDFHDEMGNHLASISILVQLLKRKTTPHSFEIQEIVEKIDKSSRTLFNGTKNFIWSIDPKNDGLYEMLLYIKDFGEDLFDNTEINFYMDITHLRENSLKLPPGWSRHIVLIIKEALTNCLKHSNCKNIYVFVKLEANSFKITIKDDGVGFCMATGKISSTSIGLENMKFRASKIKCNLGIKRGEIAGTELVLLGEIP